MDSIFDYGDPTYNSSVGFGNQNIIYETANTKVYGDNYSFLDRNNGTPYSGNFRRIIRSYPDGSRRIDYQTYDGQELYLHGTRSGAGPLHVQPWQYLSVIEADRKRLFYKETGTTDMYQKDTTFLRNPAGTKPYVGAFTRTVVGEINSDNVTVTYASPEGENLSIGTAPALYGEYGRISDAEMSYLSAVPKPESVSAGGQDGESQPPAPPSDTTTQPPAPPSDTTTQPPAPPSDTTTQPPAPPSDTTTQPPAPPSDTTTQPPAPPSDTATVSPSGDTTTLPPDTRRTPPIDQADTDGPTTNHTSSMLNDTAVLVAENSGYAPGNEDTAFDTTDEPGMINDEMEGLTGQELVVETENETQLANEASALVALMEYYKINRENMSERDQRGIAFLISMLIASNK